MVLHVMNRTYNPKIPQLNNFEFEEKIQAGDGVFELHSFPMPQIPGLKFSIRICENRQLELPCDISHYFSVQLCVKKGPRKSELKMRSELSDYKLKGNLMLTQSFHNRDPHELEGVIFKPNVSSSWVNFDDYGPKSSTPAFTGWHFGTEEPNLYGDYVRVDDSDFDNSTWTSERDVCRDFYTIGQVQQLKIEVTLHFKNNNSSFEVTN